MCTICGAQRLVEFAGRPRARCEACDALERHRALARTMAGLLADGAGRRALEVGPASRRVFGGFLREQGWRYECTDRSRRGHPADPRDVAFIDYEADLCDLAPCATASMSLVIVQHVIEEIPDYRRAIAELARVLTPAGTALLEIPFDPARARSQPQPANRYGNVWRFGAELPGVVAQDFARVEQVEFREQTFSGRLLVCSHTA